MKRFEGLVVGALLVATSGACVDDSNCSAVGGSHMQLYVVAAATLAPICNSIVSIVDTTDGETLDAGTTTSVDPSFCGFVEFDAPPGNYGLTVGAPNYETAAQRVTVSKNQCGERSIQPQGARDGLPGFGDTVSIGLMAQ